MQLVLTSGSYNNFCLSPCVRVLVFHFTKDLASKLEVHESVHCDTTTNITYKMHCIN
jgi:hypothetical protein